jgi:hypothetical protein
MKEQNNQNQNQDHRIMASLVTNVEVLSILLKTAQEIDGNKANTNPQKLTGGETIKIIKAIEGTIIANQGKTRDNPTILPQTIPVKMS